MLRLDRSRRAGPLLEWKVRIFLVGAVLGLSGMWADEPWLTGGGIVVLALGVLIRGRRASQDLQDDLRDDPQDDSQDGEEKGA